MHHSALIHTSLPEKASMALLGILALFALAHPGMPW